MTMGNSGLKGLTRAMLMLPGYCIILGEKYLKNNQKKYIICTAFALYNFLISVFVQLKGIFICGIM